MPFSALGWHPSFSPHPTDMFLPCPVHSPIGYPHPHAISARRMQGSCHSFDCKKPECHRKRPQKNAFRPVFGIPPVRVLTRSFSPIPAGASTRRASGEQLMEPAPAAAAQTGAEPSSPWAQHAPCRSPLPRRWGRGTGLTPPAPPQHLTRWLPCAILFRLLCASQRVCVQSGRFCCDARAFPFLQGNLTPLCSDCGCQPECSPADLWVAGIGCTAAPAICICFSEVSLRPRVHASSFSAWL